MDEFDLAKLKEWAHTRNVKGLQVFWCNVVNSNGWKKAKACLQVVVKDARSRNRLVNLQREETHGAGSGGQHGGPAGEDV